MPPKSKHHRKQILNSVKQDHWLMFDWGSQCCEIKIFALLDFWFLDQLTSSWEWFSGPVSQDMFYSAPNVNDSGSLPFQAVGLMCTPADWHSSSLVPNVELHYLHLAANHKQIEPILQREIFAAGPPSSSSQKIKRRDNKSDQARQPSVTDSLPDRPGRTHTVVARNVVWADDNVSQTTKHWKQTNKAAYCNDLVIWQIVLDWVSS